MADYHSLSPEGDEARKLVFELILTRRAAAGRGDDWFAYQERLNAVADELQADKQRLIALLDAFALTGHVTVEGWAGEIELDVLDLMLDIERAVDETA